MINKYEKCRHIQITINKKKISLAENCFGDSAKYYRKRKFE